MNFLNIKNIHDNSLAQFKVGLVKNTAFKVKNDGSTISIEDDANSIKIYPLEKQQQYSLFYQMTRITKDRGCLNHDDRLDCLAMMVADCLEMMSDDADEKIQQRLDDEYEKYIEYVFGDIDSKQNDSWFNL